MTCTATGLHDGPPHQGLAASRPAQIHYLKRNAQERSPQRVIVLDCESRWHQEGSREVHQLRLWAARHRRRGGLEPGAARVSDAWGTTGDALVNLLAAWTRTAPPAWLFAHNLTVDLSLSRLPLLLIQAGWRMGRNALASDQPWAHFERGSRSLWLLDSASWLAVSVEILGILCGTGKPALPDQDMPDEIWRLRCQADVAILDQALLRLMDEWDRGHHGWWSFTGPATAWSQMRHSKHGGRMVIDPDPAARAFERQAIYSGRRDLWKVGDLPRGPYAELDAALAHATICAAHQLPSRRGAAFAGLPVDHPRLHTPVVSVLARALVRTASPRYPLRWSGATLYPTGTFWTVLAGPELAEARQRGELLAIGAGYPYLLSDTLAPWAQQLLYQLTRPAGEVDPVWQAFLKMASRAVPGRFAMLVTRELLKGPSHVHGWTIERTYFAPQQRMGAIAHLAGRWQELVRDQEADDAFPAVLAFVEAYDRVALGRAVDVVGEAQVLAVNTDSLLTVEPRDGLLARINAATRPLEYRVKERARHVKVVSPQHLRLDGVPHYAGVPRQAVELAPDVFRFWTWPGMASQMERGDPRGYVRERRTVHLTDVPVSRWVWACGDCEPVQAALTATGGTQLLPAPSRPACGHVASLRDRQHPLLRGLR